jgi:hypothetical protein
MKIMRFPAALVVLPGTVVHADEVRSVVVST